MIDTLPGCSTEQLSDADRREYRERFIGYRTQLREQLAQVDRVIRELEKLCVHSFRDAGRSGPYEHAICERCGAEEFRS